MQTVQTIEEIITNLQTLHSYALSEDAREQTFHHNLLRRGNNFIVAEVNGQLFFGPSRFVGYADNSINNHTEDDNGIDGRETNRAIDAILGVHRLSPLCEYAYTARCAELKLTPASRQREYWLYRQDEYVR